MKSHVVFAVLFAICLSFIGCGADPALTSIQLTPNTATASTGSTVQYKATGTYQHGSHPATTKDITGEATWASSNQAIAAVDSKGLATAVSSGSTTITATLTSSSGPVTGSALFTVPDSGGTSGGSHNLISVAVTPGSQTLNLLNQTAQFIAIATFDSSPLSVDMTSAATWISSNPSVISFNSPGVATVKDCPASPCTVTVTASATDQNGTTKIGTATLMVNLGTTAGQRSLAALTIVPTSQSLNRIGETAQFLSFGTYTSSPTTVSMTGYPTLTWQSSNSNVAKIDPVTGLAEAVGCATSSCVATITATAQDNGAAIYGTAALTVNPNAPVGSRTLSNITIIPGAGTQTVYALGETAQFLAVGTYNESPVTEDITSKVTWQSADVNVATINSAGLATAVHCAFSQCTTTLTARMDAGTGAMIVGTTDLTVKPTGGSSPLPSLAVYLVGAGTGTVTSYPEGISCTNTPNSTGIMCTGFFPLNTMVTLHGVSTIDQSHMGGWSNNCVPHTDDKSYCDVQMTVNQTVGAIFN